MKPFLRLLRKDLEACKLPILFNCGISIIWLLYLRYRFSITQSMEIVLGLMLVPLVFIPFWILWQAYQSLRSEWRENTVYSLLLLPVPGWKILLSKWMALLIETTIIVVVFLITSLICFFEPIRNSFGEILRFMPTAWYIRNGLLIYVSVLFLFSGWIIAMQTAFVVGKLVGRFSGLVALWTLLLISWLSDRVGIVLQPLFQWVPPIAVERLFKLETLTWYLGDSLTISWNYSASVGSWLTMLGLFFLSSWLLANCVEVNE